MNNKLKYFIFGLLTFLCFNLKVNASVSVNYSTTYTVTIPDFGFENQLIDDTHTFKDFVDYISSFQSDYYDLFIGVGPSSGRDYLNGTNKGLVFSIKLIDKNTTFDFGSLFGTNYYLQFYYFYNPFIYAYSFYESDFFIPNYPDYDNPGSYCNNSTCIHDIFNYSTTNDLLSCYVNNVCSSTYYGQYNLLRIATSFGNGNYLTNSSNNVVNFGISSAASDSILYYTTLDFVLKSPPSFSNAAYVKSVILNGNSLSPGNHLPTYCELFDICPEPPAANTFIDYQTRLGTIYGSFEPSQLSNYSINVKFDTDIDSLDYYNNLGYTWNCYGRINNNGYYSYEQFPYCDFERNSNSSNGIDFNYSNFMVYDSNDNPITNLSQYDKIFIYISHQYKNDSLNKVLYNLSISSNHFVIYSDTFKGPIYESFDNLSDHFKMFITTSKSTYSYIWGKYSINDDSSFFNIRQQSYDITNFQESINPGWIASNFNRYSVNNSSNTGLMIFYLYYQYDEPLNIPFTLHLIFFPDIVISLNENVSSDNFYYYDNTGTIISSNITIDYDFNSYDNYDLSYYLKQVSSFVDDLSESAYTFSIYTQTFYDSLPFSFQTFIFILFILVCTYFVYLLIKRK